MLSPGVFDHIMTRKQGYVTVAKTYISSCSGDQLSERLIGDFCGAPCLGASECDQWPAFCAKAAITAAAAAAKARSAA